ncbi:hypothetical protein GLAREA_01873 [Glarea lozoyensis ATCC 20868]|uniref:DNA-directed RNA polymerase III subunit rpc5 n=1 Tax=Glarea lozoyensis (strain ATCC 20868 / MF5171) TaxID=1116229 RepID=S3D1P7_GLAL2|nr:uncharacterized protein GLAREA_01873 [Glarea lozoyensis ATCC 20868]EPE25961.1 hypothetical protein GLAREA_01873 [Glarea lozoyensis ATCC 20868]
MAEDNLEDPDPILKSYDIYIKPGMHQEREIYVLQFPNRSHRLPYLARLDSQPQKLRTKPNSGMVEIDVPVDTWNFYDRLKGIQWGEALKESNATKGKGSHGLPGGFGIGGVQARGKGRGKSDEEENLGHLNTLSDFAGALERDQVLKKQTLGGQVVTKNESNPTYMIGTFRKNQLHLTPVDRIAQMRPQFHHIDALSEHKRMNAVRETPAQTSAARAIHMSVKSGVDGEEDSNDTMARRIAATQAENWKHHRYVDEDTDEAWAIYQENFFVGGDVGVHLEANDEMLQKLPKLATSLDDTEYLDTISAPGDEAKLSRSKENKKGKGKGKETAMDDDSSEESDIEPAVDKGKGKDISMSGT